MLKKKSIKRLRVINYFVDAAATIIQDEGLSGITIRKVADKTGYNSATLYNYFDNLDHLVCLAALKLMAPYTASLDPTLQSVSGALDKNLKVWDLFCKFSFEKPELYNAIFFAHFDQKKIADYLGQYYKMFPADGPKDDETLSNMLSLQNIYDRSHVLLAECAVEGFFKEEDLRDIEDMCIILYKGVLTRALSEESKLEPSEYATLTMRYITRCYQSFLCEDKEFDFNL